MKPTHEPDPRRFKDAPPGDAGVEAEIGAAARIVEAASRPDDARLAHVRQRVLQRAARAPYPRVWRARAWVRTAVLVAGSLLLGGVASAVSGKLLEQYRHYRQERMLRAAAASAAAVAARGHERARVHLDQAHGPEVVPVGPPEGPPPPSLQPAQEPPHVAPSPDVGARARASRAESGHVSRPPANVDTAAEAKTDASDPVRAASEANAGEAALLARALGSLRRDRDPRRALAELDAHDVRFPRGDLRREAALARAEALLALQRTDDALALLDGQVLEGGEADRRAALARAELRAQAGRCPEAIGDFDRVLAGAHDDDIAGRALYGRALCRLRGGDLGGARVDLRAYLQRFPDGAHRAEAEKLRARIDP